MTALKGCWELGGGVSGIGPASQISLIIIRLHVFSYVFVTPNFSLDSNADKGMEIKAIRN